MRRKIAEAGKRGRVNFVCLFFGFKAYCFFVWRGVDLFNVLFGAFVVCVVFYLKNID